MIIATLIILGATILFVTIAFVAVVFNIVLPMREQLNERMTLHTSQEVDAISRRTDEIAPNDRTNHLDVRGDIVRLARRVDDLEIVAYDRPTKECA